MKPHEYASIAALPIGMRPEHGCGGTAFDINNMEQNLAIMEAA